MSGTRSKLRYYRDRASGVGTCYGWWSSWTTSGDGGLIEWTRHPRGNNGITDREESTNLNILATSAIPSCWLPKTICATKYAHCSLLLRICMFNYAAPSCEHNLAERTRDLKSEKKYTSAKLKILLAAYIVVPGELFFTERYIRFMKLPIQISATSSWRERTLLYFLLFLGYTSHTMRMKD